MWGSLLGKNENVDISWNMLRSSILQMYWTFLWNSVFSITFIFLNLLSKKKKMQLWTSRIFLKTCRRKCFYTSFLFADMKNFYTIINIGRRGKLGGCSKPLEMFLIKGSLTMMSCVSIASNSVKTLLSVTCNRCIRLLKDCSLYFRKAACQIPIST